MTGVKEVSKTTPSSNLQIKHNRPSTSVTAGTHSTKMTPTNQSTEPTKKLVTTTMNATSRATRTSPSTASSRFMPHHIKHPLNQSTDEPTTTMSTTTSLASSSTPSSSSPTSATATGGHSTEMAPPNKLPLTQSTEPTTTMSTTTSQVSPSTTGSNPSSTNVADLSTSVMSTDGDIEVLGKEDNNGHASNVVALTSPPNTTHISESV